MVSRTARIIAGIMVPLSIGSLVIAHAIRKENPDASDTLRLFGSIIPGIIITTSVFLPEEGAI